ncbi:MAG: T9SS type A sorting domain-containing protein [Bacteroidales bacterium]|nr:T9SS type A sorting domain-containing protein [Bacteroidales bacterium]
MTKKIPFLIIAAMLAVVSMQAQNVIGRFNYDSLRAPNVLCTYGTYNSFNNYTVSNPGPYANVGIIDYGPTAYGASGSPASRHTVHTDVLKKDSISGDSLLCIPSGKSSSVRLGCFWGACVCQAVAYTFRADTLLNNLLTVNYAPVMYNPGHPANQQPRLYIEILDSADNQLGYMDIASYNPSASGSLSNLTLTWRNGLSGGYYYIDWTPLSINMHRYHGRTIKLRITTFGCGQGATHHCGYTYYTVDYNNLSLITDNNSLKSNHISFSAPEGYMKYEWRLDSASVLISDTSHTADIPRGMTFSCKVTDYMGNTKILRSKAVPRRPYSNFSYIVDNPDCDTRIIKLTNLAQLFDTTDNTPLPDLEDFHWIIDNSKICYQHDPVFETTPGWHTISLINKSGSTSLSDTLTQRIYVSDSAFIIDTIIYDTINTGESYTFHGRILTTTGNYYDTTQTGNKCFNVEILKLTVRGQDGINTAETPEITIYPNPATDRVTVDGCSIDNVTAIDIAGRTIAVPHTASDINISGLQNGIYTLRIATTDGHTAVRRLVKK